MVGLSSIPGSTCVISEFRIDCYCSLIASMSEASVHINYKMLDVLKESKVFIVSLRQSSTNDM